MDTIKNCIETLLLLERRLGAKVKYRLFDGKGLDVTTIHGLQQAAREIAVFLGIAGVTFIVAIARQKPGVGGHVELQHGQKQVFIEISTELAPFPEAVLATLAHEITHKYLHIHQVELPNERENEELTDTAAIFLGLGSLLLNGAYYQRTSQELTPQGTRTVTESGSVGYLGKDRMALTYVLACVMRRIPATVYEPGLSITALQAVRQCFYQHGDVLDEHLQDFNMLSAQTEEHLRTALHPHRVLLAQVDRDLRYLRMRYLQVMETISKRVHGQVHVLFGEMKAVQERGEPDPCIRYLELLRLKRDTTALAGDQGWRELRAIQDMLAHVGSTLDAISNGALFPNCEPSEVVCPRDGTRIAGCSTSGVQPVRCPTCLYEFVADTRSRAFAGRTEARTEATIGRKPRGNFLQRVKDGLRDLV